MTLPRGWDPLRPMDMLASLWSTATVAPMLGSAAVAYRTLFETVRRLVVGRRLTVQLDAGPLRMTVTEFESGLDVRYLAVGQLDDVTVVARDIEWDGQRFDRARALLRDVHIRPSVPPVLVAAPVELTLDIPAEALSRLVEQAVPRVRVELGADAVPRVRLAARPRLGALEVHVRISGTTLLLTPRRVVVGRTRLALPPRLPAFPVVLPDLARGVTITGALFEPHLVRLTATMPQWRLAVPRKRLEDLISQLGSVAQPLDLTWLRRPG